MASLSADSRIDAIIRALRRFEKDLVPAVTDATRAACGGLRDIIKEVTYLAVSVAGLIAIAWWVLSHVPWAGS